ncbi:MULTISPECIES: GNAT family N-acetyltransferase [Rhizobium]|uniref:Acetyltransferase n=1 Tax=Rhizobium tropici TaxID=398 RepID=A0A6P1CES4_RHITR|nr:MULTISPECIES: N-acetyltransferase [Rhizobium]AGB70334.1 acetyltransferase, GNAT family [Rhizobium tropici CIAT 899]MBB4245251.1 putative acetyltransferase [Rhizobium tropici]MBB5596651.1 putative acetyltransferase [Rhizobium tropici]MBB6495627.1 putative acetyltransferase [Rhizobium tropici]NEV14856.1 N-acetyltransferase [Rhizobium tropici]
MEIRPEQPGDAEAIRRTTKIAFASMKHSSQTEAQIVDALRNAEALTISLVAIEDGDVVGHIAFSPVTIDGKDCGWYGLGPLSVTPSRQKHGIGGALVREGLSRLANIDAKGCVVLGDPDYYKRFGFDNDPGLVLDGVPARYFMRLVLNGGAVLSGRVDYHEGFNAT